MCTIKYIIICSQWVGRSINQGTWVTDFGLGNMALITSFGFASR